MSDATVRGPIVVVGLHSDGGLYVFSFERESDLDAWHRDPVSALPKLPHVVIRNGVLLGSLTTEER